MSEIDDIFALKGKDSITQPVPPVSSSSIKKEKNKTTKRKRDEPTIDRRNITPETVLDTSINVAKTKRPKIENKSRSQNSSVKADMVDDMKFSDSRGSQSRKTTEEGWLIYKEEELGIHDEGGDTPLCPFDCDCCF
ncbi:hypothetical protein H2248_000699 [Termitomyces sp. 'cryptogamus']|nr:hypothetical protein H2248_000699 [Termitomyces sp. 'cryptogamus']